MNFLKSFKDQFAPLTSTMQPFLQNTVRPALSSLRENAKDYDLKSSEWTDPAAYAAHMKYLASRETPGSTKPFMTPGMTFQPRTQFGQQASAPLNISQQGRMYGQTQGDPNVAQQPPDFQYVRPGGSSGFMPQFQNPYGPQFADGGLTGTNNMAGMPVMPQQFQNPFGPQQPQQPQQPQNITIGGTPQQPGLPGLLSVGSQNPYPQGYTPIGQQPQNFFSLN